MITLHWWQLWLMLSIAVGIGLALSALFRAND